jgi:hypothetical protein
MAINFAAEEGQFSRWLAMIMAARKDSTNELDVLRAHIDVLRRRLREARDQYERKHIQATLDKLLARYRACAARYDSCQATLDEGIIRLGLSKPGYKESQDLDTKKAEKLIEDGGTV